MLLLWRIRYLDTRDKRFKDRDLYLDTDSLDPATKAAVELCYELGEAGNHRCMLRYRSLFREEDCSEAERNATLQRASSCGSVFVRDYFEDENGDELTHRQMAAALTGNPDAIMLPAGAKQHDIDYILTDKRPIPIDQVSPSQKQLNVLGYFTRDLREMTASAFYKDGPGTLRTSGDADPILETAVTDEEIRSFVTIFRRLYMEKEPANFLKAVATFSDAIQGYPLAEWVQGVARQYESELKEKPVFVPIIGQENWRFTRKRLIDVFLYTCYAHQPDERRTRQFQECLAATGGRRDLLTWLFLTVLWECAIHMRNAGKVIADFYDRYCQHHSVSGKVLLSVSEESPGIGKLETKEKRKERILTAKAQELAQSMWESDGCPPGGSKRDFEQAYERLKKSLE